MDSLHEGFEFLCRVCAANTKGKHSMPECVYILKTPELKEKLEKYLYLPISDTDDFPKILCKTCFRQVESTASLSKIAKHTQKVFQDFLSTIKPRSKPESNNDDVNIAEFTPIQLRSGGADSNHREKTHSASAEHLPMRKDEVVVNVSINDPLTRETQQKMISASQRNQNQMLNLSRFTPKSIAQRALTSTPKQSEATLRHSAKKPSPPGVINFIHGLPQQVTPLTSNYSYERIKAGGSAASSSPDPSTRNAVEAASALHTKRKNLKLALNNVKKDPHRSRGRVSLLKSAHHASTSLSAQSKRSAGEVVLTQDAVQVEELPASIIIAATKSQKQAAAAAGHGELTSSEAKKSKDSQQSPLNAQIKPVIPDDIILGQVIKDPDLLKLILKALKWPTDEQTLDLQMMRLRSSKFADIMADPNFLQDPDLTQIMGPYLAPVLLAAQAFQQQQLAAVAAAAAASNVHISKSTSCLNHIDLQNNIELANAISYKLPAETSVQLVPATPQEENHYEPPRRDPGHSARILPPKKMRRVTSDRDCSIIASDEEDFLTALRKAYQQQSANASGNMPNPSQLYPDLGPSVLSQFNALSSINEEYNESLWELLKRQRGRMNYLQQKSLRMEGNKEPTSSAPSTGTDLSFDVDDIVLVEDGIHATKTKRPKGAKLTRTPASTQLNVNSSAEKAFPLTAMESLPEITRPIIKRRKTVIQAPAHAAARQSDGKAENDADNVVNTTKSASSDSLPTLKRSAIEGNITISQKPTNATSAVTHVRSVAATTKATSTTTNTTPAPATGATPPAVAPKSASKKSQLRSILGQQLLEAIGLQKIPNSNTKTSSAQQIRSALKQSLRDAQEQQQKQRKQEATVIQDADSTTKNVVREVLLENKTKNTDGVNVTDLDVEDEIKKVALVVQKPNVMQQKKQNPALVVDKTSSATKLNVSRRSVGLMRVRKTLSLFSMGKVPVPDQPKSDIKNELLKALKEEDTIDVVPQVEDMKDCLDALKEVSVLPKKRGRKRKPIVQESESDDKDDSDMKQEDNDKKLDDNEKCSSEVDEVAGAVIKSESESAIISTRPQRTSKTLSKYYKGPEKQTARSLPVRSTRNR